MTGSEAIQFVEDMCGGQEGFTKVHHAMPEWDKNLEDFCLQRITPDEYVKRAKELHKAYLAAEFNRQFEERLVNARSKP